MTTTVTTTIITDETETISVRQGAVLVVTIRAGATADNVYTLPGASEKTDELVPLAPYTYGPYAHDQDFAITAVGTAQATVTFVDVDSGAVVFRYVSELPTTGERGVIYCTTDAAYWWNGEAFLPMGSGASGSFTTLTASGLLMLTGVEATVTAFATGGKASATALSATKNFHRISVCATAADSVLMPAASVGQMHFLRNDGAAAAQVFGAGTDTINGVATGTGVSLAAGSSIMLFCLAAGAWVTTPLTSAIGAVTATTLTATTTLAGATTATTLGATGLLNFSAVENALTAFAGGGQASATALSATKNWHRVTTVATAADSVKLPAASVGQWHTIRNDGAEAMQLFGTGADTVNGAAAATGISVAAGTGVQAFCIEAAKWVTA